MAGVGASRLRPSSVLVVALALCVGCVAGRAEERPRRVVMLHAFNYSNPNIAAISEAARKRLLERLPQRLVIDADFLDLARVSDPGHELRTANFLREKYVNTPPDVVMTLGSNALPFIIKHREIIAPKVPVVFTGVAPANYSSVRPPPDVTGVIAELDLEKTLTLAERLQPDARRLFVIAGSSPTDRRWQATARSIIEGRKRKFETTYLFELSYDALLAELSRIPRDAIVVILTFFVDGNGQTFIPANIQAALAALSPAPAYSPYDSALGSGLVGGFSETFESIGIAAADMVLEILAGKDPAAIPPRSNPGQAYRVDYNAMQRWNLRESNLPPGAIVLFKELTVWEQYRWQMVAVFAAVLLQASMIAWLLLERRRRHLAELESRGRLREVIHLDRVAAVGVMSASIAHELNQPLGAILANAETAELLLAANPLDRDQLKEILADIRKSDQRAGDIIAHLRGLLKKRGESELQEFDLNEALRDALHALDPVARKRGVLVSTHQARGMLPVRADPVHLEQVMLNLATNAMDAMEKCEPGKRTLAIRSSSIGDSEVMVSISDNGAGIPEDKLQDIFEAFYTTKSQGTGLGLSIVRTIVLGYGGKIWAENRSGGGAVFRFTLPRAKAHPA